MKKYVYRMDAFCQISFINADIGTVCIELNGTLIDKLKFVFVVFH